MIGDMIAAYIDDAENFRQIASPQSLKSHAKPILRAWKDLTFEEFCKGRNARARAYAQDRRNVDGVGDSTINREIRLLRSAINFAEREEMIPHRVTVVAPPAGPPRKRVLSREGEGGGELGRLLAALNDPKTPFHVRVFVMMALFGAQRKTCNLETKVEHVDWDARVIHFSRTRERETKKKRIDQPIHKDLEPVLREAIARSKSGYLVEFRGKGVKDVRTAYQALLRRAGITESTIHDLRRTVATHVNDALSLSDAADHIGDTITTTKKSYVHSAPKKNLKAMNVVADIVAGRSSEPAVAA